MITLDVTNKQPFLQSLFKTVCKIMRCFTIDSDRMKTSLCPLDPIMDLLSIWNQSKDYEMTFTLFFSGEPYNYNLQDLIHTHVLYFSQHQDPQGN